MIRILAAIFALAVSATAALAQSNPGGGAGLSFGQVPTAGQWNGYFQAKQDYLGALPCLVTGCTFTNPVTLAGSTFALLPAVPAAGTIAYVTDGLAANCGDSSCTTWGTNVTGGTGSLKLLVWWNNAHWTLIGK